MHTRLRLRTILAVLSAAALCSACATGRHATEPTHDGLQPVAHATMERVWAKSGEDFSQYSMIGVLDCYVAFEKGWRLDHPDLRRSDLDRVRSWIAAKFRAVLTAKLVRNNYPLATAPGKNVLLLRPALVDLDVLATHAGSDPNSTVYTASIGNAKLYVELYDSESSEILLRAADHGQIGQIGGAEVSSFDTQSDDVRELLEHWADLILGEIDAALGKTDD